jgi:hypothetical protein
VVQVPVLAAEAAAEAAAVRARLPAAVAVVEEAAALSSRIRMPQSPSQA